MGSVEPAAKSGFFVGLTSPCIYVISSTVELDISNEGPYIARSGKNRTGDGSGGRFKALDINLKYRERIAFKKAFLIFLCGVLVFIAILSINVGSSGMSIWDSFLALVGRGSDKSRFIVYGIRLPRVLGGFFVGIGTALSGMIIQSSLNNPLASPSTLGISSASALGANIAIITLARFGIEAGSMMTAGFAFIASVLCMLLVLAISSLRRADKTTVILAGVALNSLFSAITIIIQYFADETKLAAAVAWTFGDLGRINFHEIAIVMVVSLLSSLIVYLYRWHMNAMDSGEHTAHSLGVDTRGMRNLSIFLAALNTGISVAFVGVIGFVGLLAPQVTKRIIGEDKRFMIPGTLLMGAFLVLFSDTLARTVSAPLVLPVGAITSILGAPVFVYILLKEKSI